MGLADFDQARVEARDELGRVQARNRRLETDNLDLRRRLRLLDEVKTADVEVPRWLKVTKSKGADKVTVCVCLSDLHLDEVVDPAQVDGANAYDRSIAQLRLEAVGQRVIKLVRHYVSGVEVEGLVVFMAGDNLSGNIHQELRETNHGTVMEAIVYWVPQLAALLGMWVEEFGKVHVAGVTGNHDRNTMKPVHKNRATDSFDWIIYHWLSDHFQADDRITFQIAEAPDARVQVQNTRFVLTHGDQFRGGSGIAGMLSPLMIGLNRKTRRELALDHPFDWMVMGHWHSYFQGKGIICSGAMKGYDEYAFNNNFEPEPPSQAMWIVSPQLGVTMSMPVLPLDRKREGW